MSKIKENSIVNYDGRTGLYKVTKFSSNGKHAVLRRIDSKTKEFIQPPIGNIIPRAALDKIKVAA